jgi:hypothetical protein
VDGTIQRGNGVVVAVARSGTHSFSKRPCDAICLVAGLGVEGDAHLGSTVKHRSRVRRDPTMPNLRQVHLIHAELFEELRRQGDIGEKTSRRAALIFSRCPPELTCALGRRLSSRSQAFAIPVSSSIVSRPA